MLARPFLLAMLLVAPPLGCASGGSSEARDASERDGGGRDASERDGGGRDAGASPDTDGGRRDAGTGRDAGAGPRCGAGQHACGGGCVDDLPNEPENGCRLGCGEPCPEPTGGVASCAPDGTCDIRCTPPFRREGASCVCVPRTCDEMGLECGAPDDGCGRTIDCGSCGSGACVDGRCTCMRDAHETNDSSIAATVVGTLNDAEDPPDSVIDTDDLHDARDEDWFRWSIVDGTDFGNPRITVTLDRMPLGADYELAAFYVCASGTDASTCSAGLADAEIGRGCSSATAAPIETVEIATDCEQIGSDDSGTLFVRVRATSWAMTCEPYRLTVRVR